MPNAGDVMFPSTVARRMGTTTAVADATATSGTTESVYETVTVNVVAGATYHIKSYFPYTGSVAADQFFIRLREDTTTAGTQIQFATAVIQATSTTFVETPEADWTASATGSKSFCVTVQRKSGTGTCTPKGATSNPRFLSVDYVA